MTSAWRALCRPGGTLRRSPWKPRPPLLGLFPRVRGASAPHSLCPSSSCPGQRRGASGTFLPDPPSTGASPLAKPGESSSAGGLEGSVGREERRGWLWSRWRIMVALSDAGTGSGPGPGLSQPRLQPLPARQGTRFCGGNFIGSGLFLKRRKKSDAGFIFTFILVRHTDLPGPVSVLSLGSLGVRGC